MRHILIFLNLLLLVFLIIGIANAQESTLRKVKIQIYREGSDGKIIQKDTLVLLEDLDDIQKLMGQLSIEDSQTGAFLIDNRNITINSNIEDGTKRVNIVRIQGDELSSLDSATLAKVDTAFKTANIQTPSSQYAANADSTGRKTTTKQDQYIADWDSTTLTSDDFEKKKVILQKKDFSENIEKDLNETLEESEIKSLLNEMDVDIQIAGERPVDTIHVEKNSSVSYSLQPLTNNDFELLKPFEKLGLEDTLSIDNPSFLPIEDIYLLNVDLPDSGDLAVYIRDVTGNIIFQDIQKSFSGNYRKEITISEGNGTLLFLNIAQNGKMKTFKVSKTEKQK